MTISKPLTQQTEALDTLKLQILQSIDLEDDPATDILSNQYETSLKEFCATIGTTSQEWDLKYTYLERILSDSTHDVYALKLAFETFRADLDKILRFKKP